MTARAASTDYLVVGAGGSGMAFVDTLLERTDARVVLVDRRAAAGGHWLDAYPFVRLHQPSAFYGVASRRLGEDRIDTSGSNAGMYERATAAEICAYYAAVLDGFLASGRVSFLGMSDYLGEDADGHQVVSRLTGARTVVRAGTLVDATYVESEIPLRHQLPFEVDPGARVVPPNALVDLAEPVDGVTVVGAGKTGMDTCIWLLRSGVDPDRLRWVRPREAWLHERSCLQPLELVASSLRMQGSWLAASAQAADGPQFAHLLEDAGFFRRIDPAAEPTVYRMATIDAVELAELRSVRNVVAGRRVRRVGTGRVVLSDGELPARPGEVFVDCTAAGIRPTAPRPVFGDGRITLQYTTIGVVPWSAATIAAVEATGLTVEEKNALCPVVEATGEIADVLGLAWNGLLGLTARGANAEVAAWNDGCRLDPVRGAAARAGEPEIAAAYASIGEHFGPAMANLARRVGAAG